MSCVWLASCLNTFLCGKNFNIWHYAQTFQPNFSIPAMLIGTIDFYHFIWLADLDLACGHKVCAKQNLLVSLSCTHFDCSGWNFIWCWRNSSWMSRYYLWVKFKKTREISAVLLIMSKKLFNVGMHLELYGWIWFKISMMIDTIVLYILIPV